MAVVASAGLRCRAASAGLGALPWRPSVRRAFLRSPAAADVAATTAAGQRKAPTCLHGHHGCSGSHIPRAALAAAARRTFADSGRDEPEFFPDSWVEPEALWELAQAQESQNPDSLFDVEMGLRNQRWRERKLKENAAVFNEIGAGQQPRFLWIGCCDSRVAPENLVDAEPGEIFVHRNIANMVIATDTNLRSALQYATDYLKVQHIIVCGHYDCGGVKAAITKRDHAAPLESWLAHIRDVYRLHQDELDAIVDVGERHKRLVELNVVEQCLNLFKTADIQRRRTESLAEMKEKSEIIKPGAALPRIHAMVFSPNDGILRRLPIDFKDYMKKYKSVYNLYDSSDVFASYENPL